MESKKSPPRTAPPATAGGAPPASSYFSSVFTTANGKDELYTLLSKPNSKPQNGSTPGGIGDGKSQVSPTKSHSANSKDSKHLYPVETSESPYFGSSVHYGGRDFYGSSPHKQATESSKHYKEDNQDGSIATRGDWWQGSLYY